MKLPDADNAVVEPEKVRDYLLSPHHPIDRESELSSRSRLVVGTPSAATCTVLRGLSWWQASAALPVRRRVFPEPVLPVIIDLAGPGWFLESPAGERGLQVSNLGVGLHQRFGVLTAPATPSCVLLELDPLGAYRLFGIPLCELSEQTFDVADIVGAQARELRERLRGSPDPLTALSLADEFVAQRVHRAKEPSPAVSWAWQHLLTSSGKVSVDALAENIGWSRKHLRQRFLEQVGVSPKAAPQLVRFSAAMRHLRTSGSTLPLASTAVELGYFDQSHLCRAFRHHADCTPTEFHDLVETAGVARVENARR